MQHMAVYLHKKLPISYLILPVDLMLMLQCSCIIFVLLGP